MQLEKNNVHLWIQNINELTPSNIFELEKYLSLLEKKRRSRFLYVADQKRFAVAYGMLRKILGDYLNQMPESFDFQTTAHGKPYLKNYPIEFNLSHSGDFVVWAFSTCAVGIDVEYMNRKVEILELAKRFFAPEEYRTLKQLPAASQQKAFYQCWTRKEAFIKASGEGLSYPLNDFTVTLEPNAFGNCLSAVRGQAALASNWFLTAFNLSDDYEGAVAVKCSTPQIQVLSL